MKEVPLPTPSRTARPGAPSPRRPDAVPLLFGLGCLALAGAGAWLYENPHPAPGAEAMMAETEAEADPAAAPARPVAPVHVAASVSTAPAPSATGGIVAVLEQQVARQAAELRTLQTRVTALEHAGGAVALGQASVPVDGLARRVAELEAGLGGQVADLRRQLDAARTDAAAIRQEADRAALAARWQRVAAALDAGRRLDDLPRDLPALVPFREAPPPTEAGLRRAFPIAEAAALRAGRPAPDGIWRTLVARVGDAVTIRRGTDVLVGDPAAGILAEAGARLREGDLAGCVDTVDRLNGPAARAMAAWRVRATVLLDARRAVAAAQAAI